MTAARDGKPVDSQIEMASSEGLFTSDPDYASPCVGDIQLVYIAWDILFLDEQVCPCVNHAVAADAMCNVQHHVLAHLTACCASLTHSAP